MKRRIYALILILAILAVCLAQASCQPTPTPTPVPTDITRSAGLRTRAIDAWTTAIATTTTQTVTVQATDYSTVQVWFKADLDTANNAGITPTVQMSPDNSNWYTVYSFGAIAADQELTYTALSNLGLYLRLSFAMSNTATVTPTAWVILQD